MERIVIPGDATYTPVALTDVLVAAPLASRILLGATVPGRLLQAAALGLYAGSAVKDWLARHGVRRVNFGEEFGADVFDLQPMTRVEREAEVRLLGEALNDGYDGRRVSRSESAQEVNRHLTAFIASITGQEVVTSSEVRDFNLSALIFPFAYGTCDILSGDIAIFRDTGILEPHLLAHEFSHRKGYWKELHAQVLAFLALRNSGEPRLVQAARAERLHRQLRLLAGEDRAAFERMVDRVGLRDELEPFFYALGPASGGYETMVGGVFRRLYDERMRLTGQNGLSDYDEGFTNFLHTFRSSSQARQPSSHADI